MYDLWPQTPKGMNYPDRCCCLPLLGFLECLPGLMFLEGFQWEMSLQATSQAQRTPEHQRILDDKSSVDVWERPLEFSKNSSCRSYLVSGLESGCSLQKSSATWNPRLFCTRAGFVVTSAMKVDQKGWTDPICNQFSHRFLLNNTTMQCWVPQGEACILTRHAESARWCAACFCTCVSQHHVVTKLPANKMMLEKLGLSSRLHGSAAKQPFEMPRTLHN